jgi:hypothetical protein
METSFAFMSGVVLVVSPIMETGNHKYNELYGFSS